MKKVSKVVIFLLVTFIIYELYLYSKKNQRREKQMEEKRIEEKRIEEKQMEVPLLKRISLYSFSNLIFSNLLYIYGEIYWLSLLNDRNWDWKNFDFDSIKNFKKVSLKILYLINIVLSILIRNTKGSIFDKIYKNMFYIFLVTTFLRLAIQLIFININKSISFLLEELSHRILGYYTLGVSDIVLL